MLRRIFSLVLCTGLIISVVVSSIELTHYASPAKACETTGVAAPDDHVQALLDGVNQQRAQHSLRPLVLEPRLLQSAAAKATDMLTRKYWAHYAPDGTSPWGFISRAGYAYEHAGENLAYGYPDAAATVDGWMHSQDGHRELVLNPDLTDVGFAWRTGFFQGSYTTLVVMHAALPTRCAAL
jgi:uncharacterized protein YkwD